MRDAVFPVGGIFQLSGRLRQEAAVQKEHFWGEEDLRGSVR
jgi:hypothetical protein